MISVLIVDDEKLVRDTLANYIKWQKLGIDDVYLAENGTKALALAEKMQPSIVITDIKMPHMGGMEFGQIIRRKFPEIRLVFLSGYTDKEYLKGAIHLHADGYIEKPLNLQDISAMILELALLCRREEAKKAPVLYFYRGDTREATLGRDIFTLSKGDLSQIRTLLGTKEEAAVMIALHDLCSRIRRCEGTPPDYVRNVYSQLALLIENAAEFLCASKAQAASGSLVYETSKMDCIKDLETELLRVTRLLFEEIREKDFDPVSQVNEYLKEHFTEYDITVDGIAHDLNFNTSYLCAVYKKKTGQTINTALTKARIELACKLLKDPGKKLYEVGACLGYTNGKYFTRVFTKETGISPREYRERHHEV